MFAGHTTGRSGGYPSAMMESQPLALIIYDRAMVRAGLHMNPVDEFSRPPVGPERAFRDGVKHHFRPLPVFQFGVG